MAMRVCRVLFSQFIPPPSPKPCPHGHSLCLRLDSCPANRFIWTTFSRFHIYDLTYIICFSLSDLLPSVWQTLGPSMSLTIYLSQLDLNYIWDWFFFFPFFPVSYVVWFKKHFSYNGGIAALCYESSDYSCLTLFWTCWPNGLIVPTYNDITLL